MVPRININNFSQCRSVNELEKKILSLKLVLFLINKTLKQTVFKYIEITLYVLKINALKIKTLVGC